MAKIKLSTGQTINAPDGLSKAQYDSIVTDATKKLGLSPTPPTPAPTVSTPEIADPDAAIKAELLAPPKAPDLEFIPGQEMLQGTMGGIDSTVINAVNALKGDDKRVDRSITPGQTIDELFGGNEPGGWQSAVGTALSYTPPGIIADKLGVSPETQKELLSSFLTPGGLATGVGLGKLLGGAGKLAEVESPALFQQKATQKLTDLTNDFMPPQVASAAEPAQLTQEMAQATVGGPKPSGLQLVPIAKDMSKAGKNARFLAQSADAALRSIGPQGEELANIIGGFRRELYQKSGAAKNLIDDTFKGMTPEELNNFTESMHGQSIPINDNVKKAVQVFRTDLSKISTEAQASLPEFKAIKENYFPKVLKEDQLNKLVAEKMAEDPRLTYREAQVSIEDEFYPKSQMHKSGFLEKHRTKTNLEYENDPRIVLTKYYNSTLKRLAESKHFGAKNDQVAELWSAVAKSGNPRSAQYMQEAFQTVYNNGVKSLGSMNEILNTASTYHIVTKMGFSALTNVGQAGNVPVMTGLNNAVKAFADTVGGNSAEAYKFAKLSGAFGDTLANEISNGSQIAGKFLKGVGFENVETFNRTFAASAGKFWVEETFGDLIKSKPASKAYNAAFNALKEAGVDVAELVKRGYLTQQDKMNAAYNVVKKTQFFNTPENLPLFFKTDTGRFLTLFKSFAFQQGKFMTDQVLKPIIASGDIRPLMRLAVIVPTFGEGIADAKELLRSMSQIIQAEDPAAEAKKILEARGNIFERQLGNMASSTALGLAFDAVQSAQYGVKGMASFIGGPNLSEAVDIGYPVLTGDAKALGKALVKRIPVAGQPLSKFLFPPKEKNSGVKL